MLLLLYQNILPSEDFLITFNGEIECKILKPFFKQHFNRQHTITILTKNEALAAVTVPCGLINAGFKEDNFSNDETRIPLSLLMALVEPGNCTGIKSVKYPLSEACWAKVWDRSAYSSCSFLVAPKAAANLKIWRI